MIQNKVVKSAWGFTRAIQGLCLILGVAFVLLLIHWHISPATYSVVDVSQAFQPGYGIRGIRLELNKSNSAGIWLSDLNHWTLYWLLLRGFIFTGLTWFIAQAVLRILSSIRSLETFHANNVKQLKIIARYWFVAFFFSCFNFSYIKGSFNVNLEIAFAPLLLAISSYVLAEVFHEGNQLSEDQKLMI